MRISINDPESRRFRLCLPSCLIFSRFTALFAPRIFAQNGMSVTPQQAMRFFRIIRQYRRRHRDWILVEVNASDGTYVKIKL